MRPTTRVLTSLLPLVFVACAMHPVNTGNLTINPARPLVARKVARPIYVILDPAQVPDVYVIPEKTIKEVEIRHIRMFVHRDLRAALRVLFERVEIVPPTATIPPDALVGQVQIQHFATEPDMAATGNETSVRVFGRMSWAFAIRAPEHGDFAFSHSESVTGTFPATKVDQTAEMMESTYRLALEHLFAELAKPAVLARLESPAETPKAETPTAEAAVAPKAEPPLAPAPTTTPAP